MSQEWQEKIEKAVKDNKVMVYMRGEHDAPRCGFSFRIMRILENLELKYGQDYMTEDMDSDPELWSTLKEINNWPTSPQMYVNGEFVGGCDIFIEMYKSGELQNMLTNS